MDDGRQYKQEKKPAKSVSHHRKQAQRNDRNQKRIAAVSVDPQKLRNRSRLKPHRKGSEGNYRPNSRRTRRLKVCSADHRKGQRDRQEREPCSPQPCAFSRVHDRRLPSAASRNERSFRFLCQSVNSRPLATGVETNSRSSFPGGIRSFLVYCRYGRFLRAHTAAPAAPPTIRGHLETDSHSLRS